MPKAPSPRADADAFGELYPAVYARFHARADGAKLTPQSWAILTHLMHTGPLTISEAARHFGRAQSVVSDIVSGLERSGMVERVRDARDKRRTLVWLTSRAEASMAMARRVLDHDRLAAALAKMTNRERSCLLEGMRALVRAAEMERTDT